MRAPRKCISSYQCKSGLGKGVVDMDREKFFDTVEYKWMM